MVMGPNHIISLVLGTASVALAAAIVSIVLLALEINERNTILKRVSCCSSIIKLSLVCLICDVFTVFVVGIVTVYLYVINICPLARSVMAVSSATYSSFYVDYCAHLESGVAFCTLAMVTYVWLISLDVIGIFKK